jgi:thioredoxin 1
MRSGAKFAIVVLLGAAVAAMFVLRAGKRAEYAAAPAAAPTGAPTPQPLAQQPPAAAAPGAQRTAPQPPAPLPGMEPVPAAAPAAAVFPDPSERKAAVTAGAPRLLELGSVRCMACQEMAKVLDALRASQGEKLKVDFIDVFEEPEAAERHKIALIPTQVLFDAAGREIFRHTGYLSHDDILARFRELGVKL